jgi:hypothetical protein
VLAHGQPLGTALRGGGFRRYERSVQPPPSQPEWKSSSPTNRASPPSVTSMPGSASDAARWWCRWSRAAASALVDRRSFLRKRGIAKYKPSDRLHLFDALRMTTTGKVQKAELRARVARPRRAARQRGTGTANGDIVYAKKCFKRPRAMRSAARWEDFW